MLIKKLEVQELKDYCNSRCYRPMSLPCNGRNRKRQQDAWGCTDQGAAPAPHSPAEEQLLERFGYDGTGTRGAAEAGHDGVAGGTDCAVGLDHLLDDVQALGAETVDAGLYGYGIVEEDLMGEVDVDMDDDDGEIARRGREAGLAEEGGLAKVEIFHDDGIVDMTHLVDVVETDLQWQCVHGDRGGE